MSKRVLHLCLRGALAAALVLALLVRGTLGVVLGVGALATLAGIAILEARRAATAFHQVRRRLEDCQRWAKPIVSGEPEDWDPHADERVTGLWNGCRVWVAMTDMGAQVIASAERWPAGLTAKRRSAADGAITGDDAFDRDVQVIGDDELWRPTLGPEQRRQLIALASHARLTVADRALELLLAEADLGKLEAVLDLAAAFAAALPEPTVDRMARVFELAAAEPVAAVRAGHYRWLVDRGWHVPEVTRAAAADPDPAISAWGASQRAPADGVFR